MKTTHKIIGTMIVFFVTVLTFTACSPEDGKEGEKGPTGNANVKQFTYGSKTFSYMTDYNFSISREELDNSFILAYYNPSIELESAWYNVPGTGSSNNYTVRSVCYSETLSNYIYRIFLQNNNGTSYTTNVTFTKFRIFIVPTSITIASRGEISSKMAEVNGNFYSEENLKTMSYEEICDMFNISE